MHSLDEYFSFCSVEFNDLFSRFKDDPEHDYINVNRLTEILQAFGRNPAIRDAEQRINQLAADGKT